MYRTSVISDPGTEQGVQSTVDVSLASDDGLIETHKVVSKDRNVNIKEEPEFKHPQKRWVQDRNVLSGVCQYVFDSSIL